MYEKTFAKQANARKEEKKKIEKKGTSYLTDPTGHPEQIGVPAPCTEEKRCD